jgi:hypothetical protein
VRIAIAMMERIWLPGIHFATPQPCLYTGKAAEIRFGLRDVLVPLRSEDR